MQTLGIQILLSFLKNVANNKASSLIKVLIVCLLPTAHACMILADGVLGLNEAIDTELLSFPAFKLVVGLIALVLAGAFLEESRK